MSTRTATVTGGAGFIGSNLTRGLLDAGFKVRIFDDFSTGRRTNLNGLEDQIEVVEGDIRDRRALAGAMEGSEVAFHLAANASVPRSVEDPMFIHDLNATGTVTVLLAARDASVGRIVYSSSTAVYGETVRLPVSEREPTRPLSPYGASKLAGENYCSAFSGAFGLPTISLRYFNVFGPRQDPTSQYAAVIPRFVQALVEGRAPTIFGDGEQTRDFVYVEDVVRANILAADAPGDTVGEAFNIAGGVARSVNEIAETIGRLLGQSVEPIHSAPVAGDIRHSVADVGKAERMLGFQASVPLDEGLRRTIEWFRSG